MIKIRLFTGNEHVAPKNAVICHIFFLSKEKEYFDRDFTNAYNVLGIKSDFEYKQQVFADQSNLTLINISPKSYILFFKFTDQKETFNDTMRRAAASLIQFLRPKSFINVKLHVPELNENIIKSQFTNSFNYIQSILEGLILGDYSFTKYKKTKNNDIINIELIYKKIKNSELKTLINKTLLICESVYLARDLQNEPSGNLTPDKISKLAKTLTAKTKIKTEVWNQTKLQKMNFNGLLSVGKGSCNPVRFIKLEYFNGKNNTKPVIIIGKGITFDSGGISLKPSAAMWEMKADMAGASVVLSTILLAEKLKLKTNLICLIPLAENMPSGSALKPGDIIKNASGTTIEVDNTDAEGRLILADTLWYANKLNPKAIIDLATLTGAIAVAIGPYYAGLFSRNDGLLKKLLKSSSITGERLWSMPLDNDYKHSIKSKVADLKNIGGKQGGAITAAMFLEHFVKENIPWAHIDIASSTFEVDSIPYLSNSMTGFGVRLLIDYLSTDSVN